VTAAHKPRLPELETVPKPIVLLETAALTSLAVAVSFPLSVRVDRGKHVPRPDRQLRLGVRTRIHEFASPALTRVMIAISFLGETV